MVKNMKSDYLDILNRYNVTKFYHFTNIANLDSILVNGIMSVVSMKKNNIAYVSTDLDRNDNQLNCISLSLTYTNKAMLYSKKNKIDTEWIVFEIDAFSIIEKFYNKIYYCKYNAASPSTINLLKNNPSFLKSVTSFNNIFDEKTMSPNHQSELLLDGNISISYILNIYVENLQTKMLVEQLLLRHNINSIRVIIKREMF